jgi:hypothetical protein
MKCDLEHFFATIADLVPTTEATRQPFIFSASSLPQPPELLTTDQLYIRRCKHGYNSYAYADALWFYSSRRTYRHLGLLILSVLFHERPSTAVLTLTHPASDIKHLVVEYEYRDRAASRYVARPYSFNYYPHNPTGYGYALTHVPIVDLPCFWLTNRKECIVSDDDWQRRDIVKGFGTDQASVWLAELFLKLSRPEISITDYDLEGEMGGRRCVGIMSAEAKLFLPGSIGWDETQWPPFVPEL